MNSCFSSACIIQSVGAVLSVEGTSQHIWSVDINGESSQYLVLFICGCFVPLHRSTAGKPLQQLTFAAFFLFMLSSPDLARLYVSGITVVLQCFAPLRLSTAKKPQHFCASYCIPKKTIIFYVLLHLAPTRHCKEATTTGDRYCIPALHAVSCNVQPTCMLAHMRLVAKHITQPEFVKILHVVAGKSCYPGRD